VQACVCHPHRRRPRIAPLPPGTGALAPTHWHPEHAGMQADVSRPGCGAHAVPANGPRPQVARPVSAGLCANPHRRRGHRPAASQPGRLKRLAQCLQHCISAAATSTDRGFRSRGVPAPKRVPTYAPGLNRDVSSEGRSAAGVQAQLILVNGHPNRSARGCRARLAARSPYDCMAKDFPSSSALRLAAISQRPVWTQQA